MKAERSLIKGPMLTSNKLIIFQDTPNRFSTLKGSFLKSFLILDNASTLLNPKIMVNGNQTSHLIPIEPKNHVKGNQRNYLIPFEPEKSC
jgi:hypothetical protein